MVRAQRVLIGFVIGPHLRFRIFTGIVSRGASPPSDHSAGIHPSLPVSHAIPGTRRAIVHGSSYTSVRPCERPPTRVGARGVDVDERTDDHHARQSTGPSTRRTPAEPPRAIEDANPHLGLWARDFNAPTALLGPFFRRAGLPPTALDRRPYAGRQDGGQGRCGTFRGVRQRSRARCCRSTALRKCGVRELPGLCLLRSPV
jgi:hypothetical protein